MIEIKEHYKNGFYLKRTYIELDKSMYFLSMKNSYYLAANEK